MTRPKRSRTLFDDLVLNAIDFSRSAVAQVERRPKYSLIHFDSAVELFVKARLFSEHWSLIVAKPEKANTAALSSGDFESVTTKEAINRLRNIAGDTIPKEAEAAFDAVRKHRNRVVHFIHPDVASAGGAIGTVVTDEYRAWHFLYELLTGPWQQHFKRYRSAIDRLNRKMHRLRDFLRTKYDALLPRIIAERKGGANFEDCFYCGFEAARVDDAGEPLFVGRCLVCDWKRTSLHVPCPQCAATIVVADLGAGECPDCATEIDLDYLLDKYGPVVDPKEDNEIGYCRECEQQAVVPHGEEGFGYLCLSCQTLHSSLEACGYCGTLVAGIDRTDSYLSGCVLCDGALSKDD